MGIPYAEVIGDPIAHSKSPLIHGFWLEKLGIEGDYRPVRVRSDQLEGHLRSRRGDPDWRGCNVTAPHKVAVIPCLDQLFMHGEVARAVNTVFRQGDSIAGNNSDLTACLRSLQKQPPHRGSAFIIGAGGAARAAFMALHAMGFESICVANRTPERAFAMLQALGVKASVQPLDAPLPPADLLVNASSMSAEGTALDLSPLPPHAVVFDMVFEPVETPLLAAARGRGLPTIDGLAMLIEQAEYGFLRFFHAQAPRDLDAELRELLTR
jgi:shikimate dehydrogenase